MYQLHPWSYWHHSWDSHPRSSLHVHDERNKSQPKGGSPSCLEQGHDCQLPQRNAAATSLWNHRSDDGSHPLTVQETVTVEAWEWVWWNMGLSAGREAEHSGAGPSLPVADFIIDTPCGASRGVGGWENEENLWRLDYSGLKSVLPTQGVLICSSCLRL